MAVAVGSGVAVWVPFAAAAFGSAVTLAIAYIQSLGTSADRRQAAKEAAAEREVARENRREERRQRLLDDHRERQYATLTELQEQLSEFVRAIGRAHHADTQVWQAAGKPTEYPVQLLPPGLSETLNALQRRVLVLAQRTADDEIRDAATRLVTSAMRISDADRPAADGLMRRLAADFLTVNERIGTALAAIPSE